MEKTAWHFSQYLARPIRFLEIFDPSGWRIKVYGIAYKQMRPDFSLVDAGKHIVEIYLRSLQTIHQTYGVGFMSVHQGRGENQLVLDLWINENELFHSIWVSSPIAPTELAPPERDHNSVCVWELYLQAFERQAWLEHVLKKSASPDFKGYLSVQLDAEI